MQLLVKTLKETTLTLNVYDSDTIEQLRAKIEEEMGDRIEYQRIVCKGILIRVEGTVSDWGIEDGSTLHLVLSRAS